jgi:nucleoporin NUP82
VAVLPEPSQLTARETGPLKLKTFLLGPTTHVTSQSALASVLWHPLGVHGTCLVTVTEDAIVRVWELSLGNRWSFDKATLSIDLKKLADGITIDQDFTATSGRQGFTPDSVEMEVASACFASRGSGGWSPMTLWIAMREGDVYALCPLLPEKWSPPPTLIPSLSVSIVSKVAATEDDPQADRLLAQQQLAWMADLDAQDSTIVQSSSNEPDAEVYSRPNKPGTVPKLQGPFEFQLAPEESEEELDGLLSDIFVIGPKIDSEELMFGEEDDLELDEVDQEGLSIGVICLLTSSGRLHICLDIDAVEAQWLPKTKSKISRRFVHDPALLTFQVLDTLKAEEVWPGSWPTFSPDVTSRYHFYVTDTSSITHISLSPWVFRLENELSEGSVGTELRVGMLAKGDNTIRERIYTQPLKKGEAGLAASVLIRDPDLGYFLLTADQNGPKSMTFELPEEDLFDPMRRSRSPTFKEEEPEPKPLTLFQARDVYQPSRILYKGTRLPEYLEGLRHSKYKRLLSESVRLSPATLNIIAGAHKILGDETHALGEEAALIFRSCERLQLELQNQIRKTREVVALVDGVIGDDFDDKPIVNVRENVEERFNNAMIRQKELTERVDNLKRRATKHVTRPLADKERAWADEVNVLATNIQVDDRFDPADEKGPQQRFDEVMELKDDLIAQAKEAVAPDQGSAKEDVQVPSGTRKAKVAQIMSLLDRESALVEGARNRLEGLGMAS